MGIDAGNDVQAVGLVYLEADAEVAAPGKGSRDHFAVGLAESLSERHHEGRVIALCGLHTATRFDHFCVVGEKSLAYLHFPGPSTVEVGQEVIIRRQVERGGGIVPEFYGFLSAVADYTVHQDDVFCLMGVVYQIHLQGGNIILRMDGCCGNAALGGRFVRYIIQFRILIAVGILHMEGIQAVESATRGRIGFGNGCTGAEFQESVRISRGGAVMHGAYRSFFVYLQQQLCAGGFNRYDSRSYRRDFDGFVGEFLQLFVGASSAMAARAIMWFFISTNIQKSVTLYDSIIIIWPHTDKRAAGPILPA